MIRLNKIVSAILLLCVGFLAILFLVPAVTGNSILIGHVSGAQLTYGVIIVILLLGIVFVCFRYRQNKCGKNLAIMILGSIFSVFVLMGILFLYLMFMVDSETYYTFYSPDRKYSIVAREWSWLLAGQVTLYERTSPFLIEEKESIITDDGFRPISADAYEIQWDDNVVTFTVETMDWERGMETAVVEME